MRGTDGRVLRSYTVNYSVFDAGVVGVGRLFRRALRPGGCRTGPAIYFSRTEQIHRE